MPTYDLVCTGCGARFDDVVHSVHVSHPACEKCGKPTETLWTGKRTVVPDDIPGGVEVRHGICNEDGTPRRYYSRSEMAAEAKRRGLENIVRHVGENGTDKSRHTTKWTFAQVQTEEERLAHWWSTEPSK